MTSYVIARKERGVGSIHDIASDLYDREIRFAAGCKYAIVLSSYYGGKGYTTHKTEQAAITASRKCRDYSHQIIDTEGNVYEINGNKLELENLN